MFANGCYSSLNEMSCSMSYFNWEGTDSICFQEIDCQCKVRYSENFNLIHKINNEGE